MAQSWCRSIHTPRSFEAVVFSLCSAASTVGVPRIRTRWRALAFTQLSTRCPRQPHLGRPISSMDYFPASGELAWLQGCSPTRCHVSDCAAGSWLISAVRFPPPAMQFQTVAFRGPSSLETCSASSYIASVSEICMFGQGTDPIRPPRDRANTARNLRGFPCSCSIKVAT